VKYILVHLLVVLIMAVDWLSYFAEFV